MPLDHVLILGAGPAGLSAALALAQLSREQPDQPLKVTVLEIRPQPTTTLGGTINLTPLAMRYLDRLGAGAKLRPRGIRVGGIDMVSLRADKLLGTLWPDIDALRVRRSDLVAALLETCREPANAEVVTVRFGAKVVDIAGADDDATTTDGRVVLTLEGGDEKVEGSVLIGCDGIHSAARRLCVEPDRHPVYSGKAVAYTSVRLAEPGNAGVALADGRSALRDTTLFTGRYGSLMSSFGEPSREELFMSVVMGMADVPEAETREGWKARGDDKAAVHKDILDRFKMWKVRGLSELLGKTDEWTMFPVYRLPPKGKWSKGRVMVIGDAAHAMPPQGESTGIAIEDGVLLAHVFKRRGERTVSQLFADYEHLRKTTIDKLYDESTWRWQNAATPDAGWAWSVMLDWMTVLFAWFMKWRQQDYFSSDVEKLPLPQ